MDMDEEAKRHSYMARPKALAAAHIHPLVGWVVSNEVESVAYVIDFVVDGVAFVTEIGEPAVYFAIPLNAMKAGRAGDGWFYLFPSLKAFQAYNEVRYPRVVTR